MKTQGYPTLKILFLEPFFGGSHKSVAKGFAAASRHEVTILSLPARFWKWRMRGAALWFVRQIQDISVYDLVFATDMMDLTDFKALAGTACPPAALYFHENQISYPLAPGEKRDFHLGFTNVVSAFAADLVLFNSRVHRDAFFETARNLIQKMPDARPSWMIEQIEAKTKVLYPGFDLPEGTPGPDKKEDPPMVVWNHRWEYDKDPEAFFRVMDRLYKKGIRFSLAVLGEQYTSAPRIFDWARERFRDRIRVWGYEPSAAAYRSWLCQGACVVSTAVQENFGISVMEAVALGCFPLLPDRLSYPELTPKPFHKEVIYADEDALEARLCTLLSAPDACQAVRQKLSAHARGFAWNRIILEWDGVIEDLLKKE
jgi:glycosyltransferase involved in cell wall biosynthesis